MPKARSRRSRYLALADHLDQAIRAGTYAPGERLPSVRRLCQDWTASITTVAAAYGLLEQRGLVETRAQSGHFARAVPAAGDPNMQRVSASPTEVGLDQLALMVLKDSVDPGLAPFGPMMPDPDLVPRVDLARAAQRLIRGGDAGLEAYGMPAGRRDLRVAIAQRASAFACGVGPDDLVVTAGALEAVTLALRATCAPGSTVAIESPMYYGVLQAIEALGLRALEIPTHPRDGLVLEALREALDEHDLAAVVAMPNGSNPLGSRMDDEAKRELVDLLAQHEVPLIEDDVLGDLIHGETRPRPAKSFDRTGLVLWCSSVSKTAAPGLRVGWIAPGRFRDRVEHLQFTASVGPSPLNQGICTGLFTSGAYDRFLRQARSVYAERCRGMADAVLAAFPDGTRVSRPGVGLALWVELPKAVDAQKLYAAALQARIAITPGPLFSAKLRYRHFVRLNAARWDARWREALERLGGLARRMV